MGDTRGADASGARATAYAGEIGADRRRADRDGFDAAGLESYQFIRVVYFTIIIVLGGNMITERCI